MTAVIDNRPRVLRNGAHTARDALPVSRSTCSPGGGAAVAVGPLAGYRLLSEPSNDGLFETAPAVRDDGTEVTVRIVVAELDRTQLRRVRDEAAALDNVLAVSRNPFVLPLLHHDRDETGRPVLVTARRGRSLADELTARGPLTAAFASAAQGHRVAAPAHGHSVGTSISAEQGVHQADHRSHVRHGPNRLA